MDPFLLQDAQHAYADRGGGAAGYLAARRLLDERLRRMVHWPRARDYAQLANDLAADGRDDDALLLRRVAATGGLLTEAQARWNTRYDSRAETGAERDTRQIIDAGLTDFDPDAPYQGIDGSLYWPGYTILEAGQQAPVVLVTGRGLQELIIGFGDQAAVDRWLHDRGPMASGELTQPDVPVLPRAVLEERILARLLSRPGDLPATMTALPPTTFTTDARYDIYAAITTVARRGPAWDTGDVAAELSRRVDWVPDWALRGYGGQGAPWAQAYLRRLAVTEPISYAVPHVIADEILARLRTQGGSPAAAPSAESPGRFPGLTGRYRRQQNTALRTQRGQPEIDRSPPGPRREGPAPRM